MEIVDFVIVLIFVKFLIRIFIEFKYYEFSGVFLICGLYMVIYVIIDCRLCIYLFIFNEF